MKRLCLSVLLTLCLVLSACGNNDAKAALEDFSSGMNECEGLSFTANVRAEYEHKTARFTLHYTEDTDGGTVTVIAPELIRGVTAHIRPGSTSLEYESVVLDTGSLDSFGLSPLSSMPLLVQSLRIGHMESWREEDGQRAYELEPEDGLSCTVWFSEAMVPERAELACDGRVVVYMDISEWEID